MPRSATSSDSPRSPQPVLGIVAAISQLVAPEAATTIQSRIGAKIGDALSGSVALPVVASAFVLAVFSGDAWEAMSSAPSPNIAGLALALLLSAAWLLDRRTPQPWWLVTFVVVVLFVVLLFVFLLTTSLLVQPEDSLNWIGLPLPDGVGTMESARIRLATMFAAVAVLAMVNSEKPEVKGAG